MQRRSRHGFTGALVALGIAAAVPSALAQSSSNAYQTGAQGSTSAQWSTMGASDINVLPNTDRILALQSILDMKLNQTDIAKVLPLLRDLRDRERAFYAGGTGILADMLITPEGQSPRVSAQEQLQAAYHDFQDRNTRAWDRIQSEIGAEKANGLRMLVFPPASYRDAYMTEHSARMQRIDSLIADWDRATARRIAMNNSAQSGTQSASANGTTDQNGANPSDTVRNVDAQNGQNNQGNQANGQPNTAPATDQNNTAPATPNGNAGQQTNQGAQNRVGDQAPSTSSSGQVSGMNVYGVPYSGYPHVSYTSLVDLLERRLIALDPTDAALSEVRRGGSEPFDYSYIRKMQMGLFD